MGKILSIIFGLLFIIIGILLLITWRYELVLILKGTVPALLIFGGIIALISGVSEWKYRLSSKEQR